MSTRMASNRPATTGPSAVLSFLHEQLLQGLGFACFFYFCCIAIDEREDDDKMFSASEYFVNVFIS